MEHPGLEHDVLDVFTDVPFTGNPLAVVRGGEGLSGAQMQLLAREFQLSETAFLLRPTREEVARGVSYRLRIFTPAVELPFAGHPSVGAAWLAVERGIVAPGRVVQACGAGDLPLDVVEGGPGAGRRVTLTGGGVTHRARPDAAALAGAVGLTARDVAPAGAAQAGTGVEHVHLFVRPGCLARARPDAARLAALREGPGGDPGLRGVLVVEWQPAADPVPNPTAHPVGGPGARPARASARVFGAGTGTVEDPATGSAALGLAVSAVAAGLLAGEGTSRLVVVQGVEMGRRSLLEVAVDAAGGRALAARVTGTAVAIASGRIRVPPA